MNAQRFRLAAASLAAVLALAGPTAAPAADPYVIPTILPLTGPASFLGKAEAEALNVLEDVVNKSGGIQGRPLKFAIQDDQSSPQVGVQLLNGVIAQKPAAVIGSSLVAICNAMAPIAAKAEVVQYCLSPGVHPENGSYVFSSSISTSDLLQASARFASEKGWKKMAMITSTDATGQDAERNIDAAFGDKGKYGETVVAREHFNTNDLSVAAQMTRIKAGNPEMLICWSTGTPVATLLRGVQEAGLNIPIMIGNGNQTYQQMHAYKDFLPKELYFASAPAFAPDTLQGPVKKLVTDYLDALKAKGIKPGIGESLAWDPALLEVAALRKIGPNATAQQVHQYLETLKGWTGINGTYDFTAIPQRGVGENSVVVVRWDAAKDTWVGVSKLGGTTK